MLIDTHCHLDDPTYQEDFDELIARQKQSGVERIIVPGVNAKSLISVPAVCGKYPGYLYPALGLHPEEVKEDYLEELDKIHTALSQEQWIAVGEIGLDYHFDKTFQKEQLFSFRQQLRWAAEKNIPVIIHSRDATSDCLKLLREIVDASSETSTMHRIRGVVHCFSGSREVAEQITSMGFYLGIGGVITFKNAKLAEVLQYVSPDSLLLETDGPYLAPVPFRGKRNESCYMHYVVKELANVYHCSTEEIELRTTKNAIDLFFAS